MTIQLDVEQRCMRERMSLVLQEPFFGVLMLRLKFVRDDEGVVCKTASTDGQSLYWHPPYIEKLTPAQLKGLWAHEILHVANMHQFRRGTRNPKRWNLACDGAIDWILKDAGFDVPDTFTANPDWNFAKDLSAEVIYDRIPQSLEDQHQGPPRAGGVMDTPTPGAEAEAEIKIAVKQAALAQQMKSKGTMPAWMKTFVDNICEPKVPWEELLRKFFVSQIPADFSWSKPNRRMLSNGIYMPGILKEGIGEGVIYVDTSGSTWNDRPQFWGELTKIIEDLQPERVHVVQCDAGVGDIHCYEQGEPVDPNVMGGGGSDFRPAFAAIEEAGVEPQWAVVLSDMLIDFPNEAPNYPVLAVSTTKTSGPEWAQTIFMD